MNIITAILLCLGILSGCSPAVSPGMTLWAGLNNYHEEMRALEARPERWPDRQRLAESIKTTYVATIGGSREFNRLVDLDLKRREFLIVLREERLRPERKKEIQEELKGINEQADGLTAVVKGQVVNTDFRAQEQSQLIESIATLGMLNLAIDEFSPAANSNPVAAVAKVGPYTVAGQGFFSRVRTPEGKIFQCTTTLVPEEGASIKCDPASTR